MRNATDRNGSFTLIHSPVLIGGSTIHRYYEGLFVICSLELKREFDQLDLTEGERNDCVWNSP